MSYTEKKYTADERKQITVVTWIFLPLIDYMEKQRIKTEVADLANVHHGRFNKMLCSNKVLQLARAGISLAMSFASKQDFLKHWNRVGERIFDYAEMHGEEFVRWSKRETT